jgi:ribonuclease-3
MAAGDDLGALQKEIGVRFRDVGLLRCALTHASYLNENPDPGAVDNERLEFLGDAVAGFVTAEYIYQSFPGWQEGQLTALRAKLVRSDTLARFAGEIGLGHHLLLGRGEELLGGRDRVTMLCDAFEALLGAVYLDQGLDTAREFFVPFLASQLEEYSEEAALRDAKTSLQEWAQAVHHETPRYVTVEETGPDHDKQFTVEVLIGDQSRGRGKGRSKQMAEQAAARAALDALSASGQDQDPSGA